MSIPLWLSDEGSGSYDQILDYIETVLAENTYVAHYYLGEVEGRQRLARGMLFSILHRLGARGNECLGRSNDEASWSADAVERA